VEQGWDIVIDGRDPQVLRAAALRLGAHAHPVAGDVADVSHRAELVETAAALGGIDLLVNNASTLGPTPLPHLRDYPLDALTEVYRTNVIGPLGLIQEALPLLASAHGSIINVTSDAGIEGYEGWGGYGSSKAALEQLSNVLAVEEPDVRVWWFDPGDMRTQMHQDAFPGEDISDRAPPAESVPGIVALIESELPSGRYRTHEVAQ